MKKLAIFLIFLTLFLSFLARESGAEYITDTSEIAPVNDTIDDVVPVNIPDEGDVGDASDYVSEDYVEEVAVRNPAIDRYLKDPAALMQTTPLKLRLEDCIRIALEHNAKLQATGYSIDAAKAQLMEASATGWPIFDYEYRTAPVPQNVKNAMNSFFSGEWSWWNRVKIGLAVPLYSFGKLSLAKEMAKDGVYSAQVQSYQERNTLVSRIRQLYYGVLLAEEMGRLITEAHERLENEINKREPKNGEDVESEVESSPIETLKMKVFLFELEKRLIETRQKEDLALEGLRVQMGLSPGTVFTVYSNKLRPVIATLKEMDDYVKVAFNNRPDIKLLETGLNVKKNLHLLEKRKMLPDVGLGAYFEMGRTVGPLQGVTVVDDFNDPFNFTRAGFGLQLSGKIDPHGAAARVKKAQSEYYKLNLEQMIAKEGIRYDIKDAYMRAKNAEVNLDQAREAEKTARQILFLTQSNYDIGVGEQKDIVDALQTLMMTRGRYFEAVFDFNASLAVLDEKIGLIPEVKNE